MDIEKIIEDFRNQFAHFRVTEPHVTGQVDSRDFADMESFIRTTFHQARRSGMEEATKIVIEEIETMEAEEPSNYPTPLGQDAVYGVLGRLKERIENSLDEGSPKTPDFGKGYQTSLDEVRHEWESSVAAALKSDAREGGDDGKSMRIIEEFDRRRDESNPDSFVRSVGCNGGTYKVFDIERIREFIEKSIKSI